MLSRSGGRFGLGTAFARDPLMEDPKLSFYFRRLRMIYCREQQLVEFLPDLIAEVAGLPLKEAMSGYLAAARCRRYMIKDLAWDHGISPLGEECLAMKKLIAVGSARLAAGIGAGEGPAVRQAEGGCTGSRDMVWLRPAFLAR